MPTSPPPSVDGRRPSARVLATLGAATRPDDGDRLDPLDWVRRAQEPAGRHRSQRRRPTLATVPTRLQVSRLKVSRSTVLGVLVIALVIIVLGGVRVAWALQDAQPETITAERETALTPATPTIEPAADPAPLLIVHVAGQVQRPGVVRLAPGARVVDAVEAAGGAIDGADLAAVNLARQLIDGEQVYVPLPGESLPASAVGSGPSQPGGAGSVGGVIDLNTADAATLVALPGVGPVLAQRIVDWRTEHGRFTSVDELGEVSGIGEKLLAGLRDKVSVGP